MNARRGLILALLALGSIFSAIGLSSGRLLKNIRLGLEFNGGYEILYAAEPVTAGTPLSHEQLVAAAAILERRANALGMAEPEIALEGTNRIRIKIAGLSAKDQIRAILSGPEEMPVKLVERYTQTVGGVLGATALKETLTAGITGAVLVLLFMIAMYRLAGVVAAAMLMTHLWLMLVLFNLIHATLSLSAVVAFVLGIGMAADASIIAFERIKEELRQGKPLQAAVRFGFSGSLRTILDANITACIALIVLYAVGIGPIQGFSLSMIASIVISLITNVFLSHWLLGLLVNSGAIPAGAFFSTNLHEWPERRYDFVKTWWRAALLSTAILVAGGWGYKAYGFNWDIDFTAGTALDIDVGASVDQHKAEQIFLDAGVPAATVAIGGNENDHVAARFDGVLAPDELNKAVNAFKKIYGDKVAYEENTSDPGMAAELGVKAIQSIVISALGILLFISWRFSWQTGVATIIALIHDMLVVVGIFALFHLEVDVTFIAAILTVMGYSINDKIVIFDRLRENRILLPHRGMLEVIRLSIWQTMSRSLYTVFTVVVASAALLFLGCEPLQMFALAILLGLICGAYSSIFIVCPIWYGLTRTKADQHASVHAFGDK